MLLFVVFALVGCACAAPHDPHYGLHGPFSPYDDILHHRFFQDDIFDTRSFWEHMNKELLSLQSVLSDLNKHFPSSVSTERIEGDVYKITIPLAGFNEKDIVVKAKNGLVMVQATHTFEGGLIKNYVNMRTLPNYIKGIGSWTYENDVLKMEFPLKQEGETTGTDLVTEAPKLNHSREEMEPEQGGGNQEADVGAERGDLGKETELLTNEVPNAKNPVEATTYAVDLKDEVEFVPIRY